MALKGQAAKALGWALVAALIGGLTSSTVMVSLAGPFANFALTFDSPDYFAIIVLGLATVVCLATSSLAHAFMSLFFGLLIAAVGIDSTYGVERFTFGQPLLSGGINYITVLVGAYGLGEVFTRFGRKLHIDAKVAKSPTVETSFPSWREIWGLRHTILRSTFLGTVLGVVPGAGAVITSFVSYGIERQSSSHGARIRDSGRDRRAADHIDHVGCPGIWFLCLRWGYPAAALQPSFWAPS